MAASVRLCRKSETRISGGCNAIEAKAFTVQPTA